MQITLSLLFTTPLPSLKSVLQKSCKKIVAKKVLQKIVVSWVVFAFTLTYIFGPKSVHWQSKYFFFFCLLVHFRHARVANLHHNSRAGSDMWLLPRCNHQYRLRLETQFSRDLEKARFKPGASGSQSAAVPQSYHASVGSTLYWTVNSYLIKCLWK